MASEPEPPRRRGPSVPIGDDLDIDAQIDDLAAALQFELDDEDDDDVPPDPALADADLDLPEDPPTVAEPVVADDDEDAPDDTGSRLTADAAALMADDDLALPEDPETFIGAEPVPDDDELDDFAPDEFEELDAEDLAEELDDEVSGAIDAGPAARPGRPLYLTVDGRVAKVDQDRFVIGRVSKMCDLPIIDVNISRQHCAIERRGGAYVIVDLGSTNGVQIDGHKVDNHEIAEGDVFVLSGHEMRATFFAPLPAPRPTSPATASRPPSDDAIAPAVTGRMEPVPVADPRAAGEGGTQPSAPAVDAAMMAAAAAVAPAPVAPMPMPMPMPGPGPGGGPVPGAGPPMPDSFEARMEMRLDQLAQQVAYLQQSVQLLLARTETLQGLGPLANMIQARLGQTRRGG